MRPVHFTSPANDDVTEAAEHYLNTDPDAADRFFDELDRVSDLIARNPGVGRPGARDTHAFPLHRFPYDVVYRIGADEIVVVAVAHHRRERSFWLSRL